MSREQKLKQRNERDHAPRAGRTIVSRATIVMVGIAAVLAAATARPEARRAAARPAPAAACTSAPYRQFDFFVGNWDVYDTGNPSTIVGHDRVTKILGGCVLQELYAQNDGLRGESFSLFDASHGAWHQSWVTNRGQLLLLDGGLENGRMVLTGTERAADGASSLLRGIWRRVGTGVRESAERSTDGGRTWKPVFDVEFRPHQPQKNR